MTCSLRLRPKYGTENKPVIVVLDNEPVHTSKMTHAALEERAHWLAIEWLPKYAPDLNDIEPAWKTLKETELAHQTFHDADELETAIHNAVQNRNREQAKNSWDKERISA